MLAMTLRLGPAPSDIETAAALLRAGKLVAFPTETVYGLGANACDATAAAGIFAAKARALNDPLIVHVASSMPDALDGLAELNALSSQQRDWLARLQRTFWPGPLTLVLPRGPRVPLVVSAGQDTVALRMPDHDLALALITRSGLALAAPSANLFGHVSPTTAAHVLADLDGRIDAVIDGGPTRIGVESTVLSLTGDLPVILRPGGVTREQLAQAGIPLGELRHMPHDDAVQPAPGMLSTHYAPRARLTILPDLAALLRAHADRTGRGSRTGALLTSRQAAAAAHIQPRFELGHTPAEAAQRLLAGLRALDDSNVTEILVVRFERVGLGEAIMDRLTRAAAR